MFIFYSLKISNSHLLNHYVHLVEQDLTVLSFSDSSFLIWLAMHGRKRNIVLPVDNKLCFKRTRFSSLQPLMLMAFWCSTINGRRTAAETGGRDDAWCRSGFATACKCAPGWPHCRTESTTGWVPAGRPGLKGLSARPTWRTKGRRSWSGPSTHWWVAPGCPANKRHTTTALSAVYQIAAIGGQHNHRIRAGLGERLL